MPGNIPDHSQTPQLHNAAWCGSYIPGKQIIHNIVIIWFGSYVHEKNTHNVSSFIKLYWLGISDMKMLNGEGLFFSPCITNSIEHNPSFFVKVVRNNCPRGIVLSAIVTLISIASQRFSAVWRGLYRRPDPYWNFYHSSGTGPSAGNEAVYFVFCTEAAIAL